MKTNSQAGYTLIETLLYTILFGIIIGGCLVATYGIIESTDRTKELVAVQEEANFLLRKIDAGLTGAIAVSTPSATSLSITPAGGLPALLFEQSGNNLQLTRGISGPHLLNSSSVLVTPVPGVDVFTYTPAAGGKPARVDIAFAINGKRFDMTKYLRQ